MRGERWIQTDLPETGDIRPSLIPSKLGLKIVTDRLPQGIG
jgi:hypothetical protein